MSIESSGENISFQAGGAGQLQIFDTIGDATDYTGNISGFGQNVHQSIDLQSATVSSGTTVSSIYTLFYDADNGANTSGTLTIVSGGSDVAEITLVGHYTKADFDMVADFVSSGAPTGTLEIIDPPVCGTVQSANVPLLGNYLAASFVTAPGGGAVIGGELTNRQSAAFAGDASALNFAALRPGSILLSRLARCGSKDIPCPRIGKRDCQLARSTATAMKPNGGEARASTLPSRLESYGSKVIPWPGVSERARRRHR